jgi:hypothetical protein
VEMVGGGRRYLGGWEAVATYLSELRRFAKNLNSPLSNSRTNRTTVDPNGVTLRSNKERGEQFFAKRLRTYGRDLTNPTTSVLSASHNLF